MITQVLQGTVLEGIPDISRPPRKQKVPTCAVPPDEFAEEKRVYHAAVLHRFQRCPEFILFGHTPGWDVHAECIGSASYRAVLPLMTMNEPRVLVWGDGSFSAATQRAGSAIFYGDGNPRNRCFRCPGPPDNDRAELYAFLQCLLQEDRPLRYCTDATYVHEGFMQLRSRRRARAWFRRPLRAELVPNWDLWIHVDTLARRRPQHATITCWGRGHARTAQMYAGETTDLLCHGNVAVDLLADRGSHLEPGTSEGVPHVALTR